MSGSGENERYLHKGLQRIASNNTRLQMTKRLTEVERKMFVPPLIYSISWISVNEYFITTAG